MKLDKYDFELTNGDVVNLYELAEKVGNINSDGKRILLEVCAYLSGCSINTDQVEYLFINSQLKL